MASNRRQTEIDHANMEDRISDLVRYCTEKGIVIEAESNGCSEPPTVCIRTYSGAVSRDIDFIDPLKFSEGK